MNIQNICLLLTLTGCALARDYLTDPGRMEILTLRGFDNDRLFEIFKKDYGRTYSNAEEESYRRAIFGQNVDFIRELNALYMAGEETYFLARNEYTDMTLQEFMGVEEHHDFPTPPLDGAGNMLGPRSNIPLPDAVDWRKNGSVTSVKTQGRNCHSGYAFSAIGAIEGQYHIQTRNLLSFSAQQLIDCPSGQVNYTTFGCAGGLPIDAYNAIVIHGGLEKDKDYPYTGKNGTCKFDSTKVATGIMGWSWSDVAMEDVLQEMVATAGPMSVRIDANHDSFKNYRGGIYNEPNCSNTTLNHAVLVVGYDSQMDSGTQTDYWIVKNSFGTSWGENGFIRMRMHINQCGIASNMSIPLM